MKNKFYYISYNVANYGRGKGLQQHTVIDRSPVEWAMEPEKDEFDDRPYVILYAEEITEEQYKEYKELI